MRKGWHKVLRWIDDRSGVSRLLGPILRHPVPPGTGWYYVFGSATLASFVVQVVTGIALSTSYVTSAGQAYDSLRFITNTSTLGSFIRGMHYYGASAMILLIGFHVIRVYLTGSFKYPREMNWLTGAGLLLFTLLMGFTGQLLRWDQNGMWSAVIAAEQAGRAPVIGPWLARFILAGDTVGGATLSRFYAFHVFWIPALIFAFLGWHLYLVLHNGISEQPKAGRLVDPKRYRQWYANMLKERGVPFWPDAAWRDVVFGAGVVLAIIVLAAYYGAPELGKPPDPSIVQAFPRPDWYLLWYFGLLALLPRGAENYVIVFGPLAFGLLMIAVPLLSNRGERSASRRPWAIGFVLFAFMMIGVFWVKAIQAPWSPDFSAKPLPASVVGVTTGPVAEGAKLFYEKGCEYCHRISGYGGRRGPELSDVGVRLTHNQIVWRILYGGVNMPGYGNNMEPRQLNAIVAFLQSRKPVYPRAPAPKSQAE
jgi:ubiquinol-cytochrome c reductase cytochrome b subunit